MYDMTVNMQLVVVFHHSPCCIIIIFYILSCIERIYISWCTTVRNKSIITVGNLPGEAKSRDISYEEYRII